MYQECLDPYSPNAQLVLKSMKIFGVKKDGPLLPIPSVLLQAATGLSGEDVCFALNALVIGKIITYQLAKRSIGWIIVPTIL